MPQSPELKYRWAIEYTIPQPFNTNSELFLRYDSSYQGETYRQPQGWDNENDPDQIVPSWTTANFQAGMQFENDLSVGLFVRNVWGETGSNYSGSYRYWLQDGIPGNTAGLQVHERTLQRPRTISLQLTKKF